MSECLCIMWNGNSNRLSNSSLETIPEEGNDLPRISGLIPKSPETRKKEQEYLQLYESQKQHIDTFLEMLVVQRKLKRICSNERYLVGNYDDYDNVNRSHSTSPTTMTWDIIETERRITEEREELPKLSSNYQIFAWRITTWKLCKNMHEINTPTLIVCCAAAWRANRDKYGAVLSNLHNFPTKQNKKEEKRAYESILYVDLMMN